MTHILLTGAGFTHNWGGWLAKEVEGDLFDRVARDPGTQSILQQSGGFESALETLRQQSEQGIPEARARQELLQRAVADSFRDMNMALAGREFNFCNDRAFSVNGFMARFDAIFSLNLDLLLELHYDPSLESPRRWVGFNFPGVAGVPITSSFKSDRVDQKRKVLEPEPCTDHIQPIYKLHGSTDWIDDSGDLFVVGGAKASYIESKPILKYYLDEFRRSLAQPNTRLMIIGYGFLDDHVNRALEDSWDVNRTLSIFYVDPRGRDAIYAGVPRTLPQWTPPLGNISCVGESRRFLSQTLAGDRLEFNKLMRFFADA
jgi:SIR2-like domain